MQDVNPFTFPDWNERLLSTPQASIFHTTNWLRVLHESYGYRPYYVACVKGEQFAALLPCVEVRSWFTGVRGVSLPFSDYCEPIVAETMQAQDVLEHVILTARQRQWTSLEMRGGDALFGEVSPYRVAYRHLLRLQRNEAEVFARLRSNYRAKIRKAHTQDLKVHILQSPEAMEAYYRLHCLTRKRQGLVPQPTMFFKNIHDHLIAKNFGFVSLVSHQGNTIAGAVFFCFGTHALYKFGASARTYQHLYANYGLFWHVIQWLCRHGYDALCFGRSAPSNAGLLQFKAGWGPQTSPIHYYKYDLHSSSFVQNATALPEPRYRVWTKMPLPLLKLAGSILYPHMG